MMGWEADRVRFRGWIEGSGFEDYMIGFLFEVLLSAGLDCWVMCLICFI